jgi:hypothetical protein
MRFRLIAVLIATLLPGHAFANDPTKAPRHAPPDMYRPNMDRIIVNDAIQINGVPSLMRLGPATASKGATAKGDWWFEDSTFPLKNEAGIWPGTFTYWSWGLSKEFNASNTQDSGNSNFSALGSSGPNTPLFLWANANGAHGAVVANMTVCVARTATDVCFGGNDVARNAGPGSSGAKLVGREIDVEPAAGTTTGPGSAGLVANIFGDSTSYVPAFLIGGVGGGSWSDGIVLDEVRGAGLTAQSGSSAMNWLVYGPNGTYNQAAIRLGLGATQGLLIGDPSSDGASTKLYADATANDLTVATPTNAKVLLSASYSGNSARTRYPFLAGTISSGLDTRKIEQGAYGYASYIQSLDPSNPTWLSLNPLGGNVGVNTTSPGAALDVAGTMRGQVLTLSAAPTTSNIPASYWTVVKRTDDASVKLCANDAGAIKCVAMQ